MDTIVREVKALKNKIWKALDSIQQDIRKISDAIQEQSRATRNAYAARQAQRSPEPTSVKVIESIETHRSSADKKNETDYHNLTIRWQKFTFWAVFAYAGIAALQWLAFRDANDISRQTLKSVNRAYITSAGVNSGIIQNLWPIGSNLWQFDPIWENVGNTPASPVIHDFFAQILDGGEPNEERFVGIETQYPVFMIGPHVRQEGVIRFVQQSELLEARVGATNNKIFFAWGWIAYRDVITKDPHVTEFCLELKEIGFSEPIQFPKAPGGVPAIPPGAKPSFRWTGCNQHNCFDENCKDYERIEELLPKMVR